MPEIVGEDAVTILETEDVEEEAIETPETIKEDGIEEAAKEEAVETPETVKEDSIEEAAIEDEVVAISLDAAAVECDKCEVTVEFMKRLLEHMEKIHENPCCSECKMPAELVDKLLVHMRREHGYMRSEFTCDNCERKTDRTNKMKGHKEDEHEKEGKKLKMEKNKGKKLEKKKRRAKMEVDERMKKKR